MTLPRMTPALAARIDRAEAAYVASDMAMLAGTADNPLGVGVHSFGRATALLMREINDWEFNRVLGLRDQSPSEVDEILAWYAQYDASCHFDIVSPLASKALLQTLADRGFSESGSHDSLFVVPVEDFPEPPTGIDVIEVLAGHMEIFADLYMVYLDDFKYPDELKARVRANIIKEYRQPGWRLYLAAVDGAPAAFASLYVQDRIGSLAMAAAAPSSRGRGAHTALLTRRIADAAAEGCELVIAQAVPASTSHRKLERAGLKVAYTKTIWSRPQPAVQT